MKVSYYLVSTVFLIVTNIYKGYFVGLCLVEVLKYSFCRLIKRYA